MRQIGPGVAVLVTDSKGRKHPKIALSAIVEGTDIQVVWVCRTEEWETSRKEGREAEGMPWPASDVELSR